MEVLVVHYCQLFELLNCSKMQGMTWQTLSCLYLAVEVHPSISIVIPQSV